MLNVSNYQKVFFAKKAENQKFISDGKSKSVFWPKVFSGQKSFLAIIHFWLKSHFWPKRIFWPKCHFWPKMFLNQKRIRTAKEFNLNLRIVIKITVHTIVVLQIFLKDLPNITWCLSDLYSTTQVTIFLPRLFEVDHFCNPSCFVHSALKW